MSSKDKTRQKLMESMRKTKAGASKNASDVETEEQSKPARNASKKETVPAKKQTAKTTGQTQTDPYQSPRRRVWPD